MSTGGFALSSGDRDIDITLQSTEALKMISDIMVMKFKTNKMPPVFTSEGGYFYSKMDEGVVTAMYYHKTKSHIAIACNGNGEKKSVRAGPGKLAVAFVPRTPQGNETHYWTDDESKLDAKWKPVQDA